MIALTFNEQFLFGMKACENKYFYTITANDSFLFLKIIIILAYKERKNSLNSTNLIPCFYITFSPFKVNFLFKEKLMQHKLKRNFRKPWAVRRKYPHMYIIIAASQI